MVSIFWIGQVGLTLVMYCIGWEFNIAYSRSMLPPSHRGVGPIRPVHELVRVGFVPNLKLTRSLCVFYTWTHHQPVEGGGSGGRMSLVFGWVLVSFRLCETSPDFTKISWILAKSTGFGQIWPDVEEISMDLNESWILMRSGQILTRSQRILKRSGQISTN